MNILKRYQVEAIWADIEYRNRSIDCEFCSSEDVEQLEQRNYDLEQQAIRFLADEQNYREELAVYKRALKLAVSECPSCSLNYDGEYTYYTKEYFLNQARDEVDGK